MSAHHPLDALFGGCPDTGRLDRARLRAELIVRARHGRDSWRESRGMQAFWAALLLTLEDADRAQQGLPPLGTQCYTPDTCRIAHIRGRSDSETAEPNTPPRTPDSEPTRDHDQGPRSPTARRRTPLVAPLEPPLAERTTRAPETTGDTP